MTNWISPLAHSWARLVDSLLDLRGVDLGGRIGDPRRTCSDFDVIRGYLPDHS